MYTTNNVLVKVNHKEQITMVDTFQVDRKAWELAKAQDPNAPVSTIAERAQEIKRKLIEEEKGKQQ
jgi:hypothetical protein